MTIFIASIYHRPEKPFGHGRTAQERHSRVVGGYRAEIIDGLADGQFCYTGVCQTRDAAKAELVAQLKRLGHTGTLRFT